MNKQTRIIPLDEIRSRDFLPGEIGCAFFCYDEDGEEKRSPVRCYLDHNNELYFFTKDIRDIFPDETGVDDSTFSSGPEVSLHLSSVKEDAIVYTTVPEHWVMALVLCSGGAVSKHPFAVWLKDFISSVRKTGDYVNYGINKSSVKTISDLMAFMDLVHEQIAENFQKQDLRIEAEREDLSKQIELATDNIIRLKDEVQALKETSNVIKDQTTALGSKVFDSVMPMINTPPEEDQEVIYEEPKPKHPWTEEDYDKFRMYFAQTAHILGQPLKVWMSTIWTLIKMEFKYCPRDIKISGIGYKAFCKAHEQDPDTYPGDMSSLIKVMDDYVFCKDDSVSPITSTFVWQQGKELYNKLYKRRNIYRKKTDVKSKASGDAVAKQKELLLSDYQDYSDFVEEHKVFSMPRVAVTVSGDVVSESLADNVDSLFSFSFTGVGGRSCSEEDAM